MNAIFRILNDYSFTRLVFFLTKIIYFSYRLNNRKIHSCPESIDVLSVSLFTPDSTKKQDPAFEYDFIVNMIRIRGILENA